MADRAGAGSSLFWAPQAVDSQDGLDTAASLSVGGDLVSYPQLSGRPLLGGQLWKAMFFFGWCLRLMGRLTRLRRVFLFGCRWMKVCPILKS